MRLYAVFRRRGADQDIADLPGGGLVHQPHWFTLVFRQHDLRSGFVAPSRAQTRIELR